MILNLVKRSMVNGSITYFEVPMIARVRESIKGKLQMSLYVHFLKSCYIFFQLSFFGIARAYNWHR